MNLPVLPQISLEASDTPETAAARIQPAPPSIILLLGDFDAALQPKVRSILSRAVAPVAFDSGSLIIDNGVSASSLAMGLAASDQDTPPRMLAIVTHGAAAVEPNHPLAMRLPAEWTDIAKANSQIAAQLAKAPQDAAAADRERPVLAILSGGSDDDLPALIQCARRQWPILLIAGTGGLADRIVAAIAPLPAGSPPPPAQGPAMAEILDTASLSQVQLAGPIDSLQRILVAHLEVRAQTLADAWLRYDALDGTAVLKQASFKTIQMCILLLGVMATFLAISQSGGALPPWLKFAVQTVFGPKFTLSAVTLGRLARFVHFFIILVPITVSVLVAINKSFRDGNKWVDLRSAAESIKSEIFRYRAQAGPYSSQQSGDTSSEARLAAKIKEITSSLVQTEVNKSRLERPPKDDPKWLAALAPEKREQELLGAKKRLQFLTPDEYIVERVEDQAKFMLKKTTQLDRQLKQTQWWIYGIGGLGTLLAAVNSDVWVALTTALATALTTKLESEQVENSLVQYNQALVALQNIETWWKALSKWEKARRTNIDLMVEQTEQTMAFELRGWAQQMQSALDKLTERESGSAGQSQSQTQQPQPAP